MRGMAEAVSAVACIQLVSAVAKLPTFSSTRAFLQAATQLPEPAVTALAGLGLLAEAATGTALLVRPTSAALVASAVMWLAFLALQGMTSIQAPDIQCFCHGWLLGHLPKWAAIGLNGTSAVLLATSVFLSAPRFSGLTSLLTGMPLAMGILLLLSVREIVAPWRVRFNRCSLRRSPLARLGGAF